VTAGFGVSHTVIREALKILATKGLVVILHGQGVRVLPDTAWHAFDPLVLASREQNGSLLQLVHVCTGEAPDNRGGGARRNRQAAPIAMESHLRLF